MDLRTQVNAFLNGTRGCPRSSTHKIACFLVILIFGGTLLLTTFLRVLPIHVPESEFLALASVGAIYGVFLFYHREVVTGLVISLITFVTLRINIPMSNENMLLAGVGPNLWLVHVPIIGLVSYFVYVDESMPISHGHFLYAGFVIWAGLCALFGSGPRLLMAIYFALFVGQAGIIFVLSSWIISIRIVSLQAGLSIFVTVVFSHCVLGILQFINGGALGGFGHLGEASRTPAEVISVGPFSHFIGPHVNGLAYGGPISILVTLALPISISLAFQQNGKERFFYVIAAVCMAIVQRVSAWDAGRGGTLIAIFTLFVVILYVRRRKMRHNGIVSTGTAQLLYMVTVTLPILAPSERSGSTTSRPDGNEENDTTTIGELEGDNVDLISVINDLSVPLFDLSNLGIRFQQYILGFTLFLKYPIFGVGGANFYYISDNVGLSREYLMHNLYISLLVETGLPGLLLYMLAIGTVYYSLWKLLKKYKGDIYLIGAGAGITGVLAQLFFQPQIMKMPSLFSFWLVCGLIVGDYLKECHKPGDPT